MMHANKMILVPHEIVGGNENTSKYISNLDREMLNILQDKGLPIDAKVLQYNQILRRYQSAKQDAEKPFQLEITEPAQQQQQQKQQQQTLTDTTHKVDSIEEAVLNTVPKKWHKQASLLLKYAQKSPHVKWSENGEMIIDGNKIVGSNIVDLINDFSRTRNTDPAVGADIFLKKMIEANIPKETIVNKKRLSLLEKQDVYASPQAPTPTKSDSSRPATPSSSASEKIKHHTRSLFGKWTHLT